MAAEEGNKYAEKWTKEDVVNLCERAYEVISEDCFYLSSVADELDEYPDLFNYLAKKFKGDEEVFRSIKRMYVKCERIITEKAGKGDIVPSVGIFILKAYHGLMETSKQQIDHKNDGGKFEVKNDLTPEQMDKLIEKL